MKDLRHTQYLIQGNVVIRHLSTTAPTSRRRSSARCVPVERITHGGPCLHSSCRERVDEDSSKMGVPHITSFCWCMGLEVGAKCVGFLHLVSF